jgi:hypothetical protein
LSDASRLERRQRLDEIARAAEEMRRGQFDAVPTLSSE